MELRAKMFAMKPELRAEWLALIIEIDRSVENTRGRGAEPPSPKFDWEKLPEGQRTAAMLNRRSELLAEDLTAKVELQSEWVLLMRRLEATERRQQSSALSPTPTCAPAPRVEAHAG